MTGTTTPPPGIPLPPEIPKPAAEPLDTGVRAPVIQRPEGEKLEPVFAVEIAPGFWIRHFYTIVLQNGMKIEAQSDEFLPNALIDEAKGEYKGRLLAVPGHYWFLTDLIPRDQVVRHHIFQRRVPGRTGISVTEI